MNSLLRFTVWVRLCATVTFLCYLAAGASLSLPSLVSCVRCAKQHHHAGMQSGTSCPLSYTGQGHECHEKGKKSSGSIKLCPDGCLRHDEQSGEVAAIAKFVSPLASLVPDLSSIGELCTEQVVIFPTRTTGPPDHPPSLFS